MGRFDHRFRALPLLVLPALRADSVTPTYDAWISTGDNHFLENALPIDSPATIDVSFRLLKEIGVRRIYWRGLLESTWAETAVWRPENPRYP